MPLPTAFNEKYLIDWVKSQLGSPAVRVEIDEPQIQMCVQDTLEVFQRYRPVEKVEGSILPEGVSLVAGPENNLGLLDLENIETDHPDSA